MSSPVRRPAAEASTAVTGHARPASALTPPDSARQKKGQTKNTNKKSRPGVGPQERTEEARKKAAWKAAQLKARKEAEAAAGAAWPQPGATASASDNDKSEESDEEESTPETRSDAVTPVLTPASPVREPPTPIPPTLFSSLPKYVGAKGDALRQWLREAEQMSNVYGLNDAALVRLASNRLGGVADQWWVALGPEGQAALIAAGWDKLKEALISRFVPITTEAQAREELLNLHQGNRSIDDYVAEYQRLRTLVPAMDVATARHCFTRGLTQALQAEVSRLTAGSTLQEVLDLVVRIGNNPHRERSALSARQMEAAVDTDRLKRIVEQHLLALTDESKMGSFAARKRAFAAGSRAGRGSPRFHQGNGETRLPTVPGVPPELVQRRRDAQLCYRCGSKAHTRFECTNASNTHPVEGSSN